MCRWASSHPLYKCILVHVYGKSTPINVYTIMEDNKKCSLFPFKLSCLMQKIISTVKCWIINWFLSESNKINWIDKGQVVRLSTAEDWMEGYKCIFEMKSWPIDVQITWKMGAIPAAHLYHTKYRELPPPPPPGHIVNKISQNLAHLEASSKKIIKSHRIFRLSYNTFY